MLRRIFNMFFKYRMLRGMRMGGPGMFFLIGVPIIRKLYDRYRGGTSAAAAHPNDYKRRAA